MHDKKQINVKIMHERQNDCNNSFCRWETTFLCRILTHVFGKLISLPQFWIESCVPLFFFSAGFATNDKDRSASVLTIETLILVFKPHETIYVKNQGHCYPMRFILLPATYEKHIALLVALVVADTKTPIFLHLCPLEIGPPNQQLTHIHILQFAPTHKIFMTLSFQSTCGAKTNTFDEFVSKLFHTELMKKILIFMLK